VYRWRPIRQHGRRAKAAQISAIAVVLGLLLFTSFLVNYLTATVPAQAAEDEFEHTLQVENQLSRLQSMLLAQSGRLPSSYPTTSPVTLGSSPVPPFSPASSGSVGLQPVSVALSNQYSDARIVSAPPAWGVGSSCLYLALNTSGSVKCAGNGNLDEYNYSGNGTASSPLTVSIAVHGNSNSLVYNILGSYLDVTIDWTGGDTGFVEFVLEGNHDTVNYDKGGSDSNSPEVAYAIYGQYDSLNVAISGSHSGKGSMDMEVAFVGDVNATCPYQNSSNTDTFSLSPGGSNLFANITWWNFVGYTSSHTYNPFPGISGSVVTFKNETGFRACAFTIAYGASYTDEAAGGLAVHLNNRYVAPADLVYEAGAVILSHPGEGSIMVSPPQFTFTVSPKGNVAHLLFVTLLTPASGATAYEAGTETAGIITQVLGVHSYAIATNLSKGFGLVSVFLNLTTPYPYAWASFFQTFPYAVDPSGFSCTLPAGTAPGTNCLFPPAGASVMLSGELVVAELDITTVTAVVNLT
jgi:hypothetical protein